MNENHTTEKTEFSQFSNSFHQFLQFSSVFTVFIRRRERDQRKEKMAAMCAPPSHDSASAEMAATHLQNIKVQMNPPEFVWVKPPHPNVTPMGLDFPDNSWKSCIRSNHEAIYGRVPILCKADSDIAFDLGEALIKDKDSNEYWGELITNNIQVEDWMMSELNRMKYDDEPFVLVHNDPAYDTGNMCERVWEEEKDKGIPPEVQRAMLHSDWEKDKADEEMIKDMARFECEANLNILRSTPPEDRFAPSEHHIKPTDNYSGWTRKNFPRTQRHWDSIKDADENSIRTPECQHLINGHDYKFSSSIRYHGEEEVVLQSMFMSERIRCNGVVICKPSNGLGYGLLACDYGLVHVANKYLPIIPEIGMCITVTISPTDVGDTKPFPLTAVFIHK